MFVGSIVTDNIYHFDLNEDRTQLVLTGELEDKIAETRKTGTEDIVFGEGFAGISDLEVGSDDYLYVVSLGQVANEYKLDKEATVANHILDAFRLALTFYKRTK
jgi:hypothetical protein